MSQYHRLVRLTLLTSLAAAAILAAGCGSEGEGPGVVSTASGVEHVHGLGVDPADESLVIATHSGLFRAPDGEQEAERIGDRRQDTMGFTVVGPGRYLGSGHPDLRDDLPPLLGLIRSDDGGRSWDSVALLGEADFHVLRSAGPWIYGVNSLDGALLVSSDAGRNWQKETPPGPLVDVVPDPADPRHLIGATEDGVHSSDDGGASWRPRAKGPTGLLAWPSAKELYLLDGSGVLRRSGDAGRSFETVGSIDGQPAAFAAHRGDLYVALHSNEIRVSSDGGRTWRTRVSD